MKRISYIKNKKKQRADIRSRLQATSINVDIDEIKSSCTLTETYIDTKGVLKTPSGDVVLSYMEEFDYSEFKNDEMLKNNCFYDALNTIFQLKIVDDANRMVPYYMKRSDTKHFLEHGTFPKDSPLLPIDNDDADLAMVTACRDDHLDDCRDGEYTDSSIYIIYAKALNCNIIAIQDVAQTDKEGKIIGKKTHPFLYRSKSNMYCVIRMTPGHFFPISRKFYIGDVNRPKKYDDKDFPPLGSKSKKDAKDRDLKKSSNSTTKKIIRKDTSSSGKKILFTPVYKNDTLSKYKKEYDDWVESVDEDYEVDLIKTWVAKGYKLSHNPYINCHFFDALTQYLYYQNTVIGPEQSKRYSTLRHDVFLVIIKAYLLQYNHPSITEGDVDLKDYGFSKTPDFLCESDDGSKFVVDFAVVKNLDRLNTYKGSVHGSKYSPIATFFGAEVVYLYISTDHSWTNDLAESLTKLGKPIDEILDKLVHDYSNIVSLSQKIVRTTYDNDDLTDWGSIRIDTPDEAGKNVVETSSIVKSDFVQIDPSLYTCARLAYECSKLFSLKEMDLIQKTNNLSKVLPKYKGRTKVLDKFISDISAIDNYAKLTRFEFSISNNSDAQSSNSIAVPKKKYMLPSNALLSPVLIVNKFGQRVMYTIKVIYSSELLEMQEIQKKRSVNTAYIRISELINSQGNDFLKIYSFFDKSILFDPKGINVPVTEGLFQSYRNQVKLADKHEEIDFNTSVIEEQMKFSPNSYFMDKNRLNNSRMADMIKRYNSDLSQKNMGMKIKGKSSFQMPLVDIDQLLETSSEIHEVLPDFIDVLDSDILSSIFKEAVSMKYKRYTAADYYHSEEFKDARSKVQYSRYKIAVYLYNDEDYKVTKTYRHRLNSDAVLEKLHNELCENNIHLIALIKKEKSKHQDKKTIKLKFLTKNQLSRNVDKKSSKNAISSLGSSEGCSEVTDHAAEPERCNRLDPNYIGSLRNVKKAKHNEMEQYKSNIKKVVPRDKTQDERINNSLLLGESYGHFKSGYKLEGFGNQRLDIKAYQSKIKSWGANMMNASHLKGIDINLHVGPDHELFNKIKNKVIEDSQIKKWKDSKLASLMNLHQNISTTLLNRSTFSDKNDTFHIDNFGLKNFLLIVRGGKSLLKNENCKDFRIIYPTNDELMSIEFGGDIGDHKLVVVDDQKYIITPWRKMNKELCYRYMTSGYGFLLHLIELSMNVKTEISEPISTTMQKFAPYYLLVMHSKRKTESFLHNFRYVFSGLGSDYTTLPDLLSEILYPSYTIFDHYVKLMLVDSLPKYRDSLLKIQGDDLTESLLRSPMPDLLTGNDINCSAIFMFNFHISFLLGKGYYNAVIEQVHNLRSVLEKIKSFAEYSRLRETTIESGYPQDETLSFSENYIRKLSWFACKFLENKLTKSEINNITNSAYQAPVHNMANSNGLRGSVQKQDMFNQKGHTVVGRRLKDIADDFPDDHVITFQDMMKYHQLKQQILHQVDKVQKGGSREILAMDFVTKLYQNPIEKVFAKLASYIPNEFISVPSSSRAWQIHGMFMENPDDDFYSSSVDLSLDCSSWAAGSNILKYQIFVEGLKPVLGDEVCEHISSFFKLYEDKIVIIKPSVYDTFILNNNIPQDIKDMIKVSDDGSYYFFRFPNSFMMGIFNYLSSIVHAVNQMEFCSYINERLSREGVTVRMTSIAHSDDSMVRIFISNRGSRTDREIINQILYLYEKRLKLANHMLSKKKCVTRTHIGNTDKFNYIEFISVVYIQGNLMTLSNKYGSLVEFKPTGTGYWSDLNSYLGKIIEYISKGGSIGMAYLKLKVFNTIVSKFYNVYSPNCMSDRPVNVLGHLDCLPIFYYIFGSDADTIRLLEHTDSIQISEAFLNSLQDQGNKLKGTAKYTLGRYRSPEVIKMINEFREYDLSLSEEQHELVRPIKPKQTKPYLNWLSSMLRNPSFAASLSMESNEVKIMSTLSSVNKFSIKIGSKTFTPLSFMSNYESFKEKWSSIGDKDELCTISRYGLPEDPDMLDLLRDNPGYVVYQLSNIKGSINKKVAEMCHENTIALYNKFGEYRLSSESKQMQSCKPLSVTINSQNVNHRFADPDLLILYIRDKELYKQLGYDLNLDDHVSKLKEILRMNSLDFDLLDNDLIKMIISKLSRSGKKYDVYGFMPAKDRAISTYNQIVDWFKNNCIPGKRIDLVKCKDYDSKLKPGISYGVGLSHDQLIDLKTFMFIEEMKMMNVDLSAVKYNDGDQGIDPNIFQTKYKIKWSHNPSIYGKRLYEIDNYLVWKVKQSSHSGVYFGYGEVVGKMMGMNVRITIFDLSITLFEIETSSREIVFDPVQTELIKSTFLQLGRNSIVSMKRSLASGGWRLGINKSGMVAIAPEDKLSIIYSVVKFVAVTNEFNNSLVEYNRGRGCFTSNGNRMMIPFDRFHFDKDEFRTVLDRFTISKKEEHKLYDTFFSKSIRNRNTRDFNDTMENLDKSLIHSLETLSNSSDNERVTSSIPCKFISLLEKFSIIGDYDRSLYPSYSQMVIDFNSGKSVDSYIGKPALIEIDFGATSKELIKTKNDIYRDVVTGMDFSRLGQFVSMRNEPEAELVVNRSIVESISSGSEFSPDEPYIRDLYCRLSAMYSSISERIEGLSSDWVGQLFFLSAASQSSKQKEMLLRELSVIFDFIFTGSVEEKDLVNFCPEVPFRNRAVTINFTLNLILGFSIDQSSRQSLELSKAMVMKGPEYYEVAFNRIAVTLMRLGKRFVIFSPMKYFLKDQMVVNKANKDRGLVYYGGKVYGRNKINYHLNLFINHISQLCDDYREEFFSETNTNSADYDDDNDLLDYIFDKNQSLVSSSDYFNTFIEEISNLPEGYKIDLDLCIKHLGSGYEMYSFPGGIDDVETYFLEVDDYWNPKAELKDSRKNQILLTTIHNSSCNLSVDGTNYFILHDMGDDVVKRILAQHDIFVKECSQPNPIPSIVETSPIKYASMREIDELVDHQEKMNKDLLQYNLGTDINKEKANEDLDMLINGITYPDEHKHPINYKIEMSKKGYNLMDIIKKILDKEDAVDILSRKVMEFANKSLEISRAGNILYNETISRIFRKNQDPETQDVLKDVELITDFNSILPGTLSGFLFDDIALSQRDLRAIRSDIKMINNYDCGFQNKDILVDLLSFLLAYSRQSDATNKFGENFKQSLSNIKVFITEYDGDDDLSPTRKSFKRNRGIGGNI